MRIIPIVAALLLIACGERSTERTAKERETPSQPTPVKLSIIDVHQLSDSEQLTLIAVPSPLMPEEPEFATQCLLYRNTTTGTATLNCGLE